MNPITRNVCALAVVVAASLGGLHGVVTAQNFGGAPVTEQYFRVDAEPGVGPKGRPVLRGDVHNRSAVHVDRIRLRVDPARTDGAPAAPVAMGWVNGDIEANGRRYFEVVVPRADAGYRVSVESFEVRFNDLSG